MATFNTLNDPLSKFCGEPFWNASTAWDTHDPELGFCLERTVLVWGPCLFLWMCAPIYIITQRQGDQPAVPWSGLLYSKVVLSLIATAAAIAELALVGIRSSSRYDFVTPLTLILSYTLQIFLVLFGRRYGERSSGLIWMFWLSIIICGIPQFKSSVSSIMNHDDLQGTTITFLIQYISAVAVFTGNCFADNPSDSHLLNKKVYPDKQSSFLSNITFHWANPLIWSGWKRSLTFADLWYVPPDCAAKCVDVSWKTAWSKELSVCRQKTSSKNQQSQASDKDGEPSGPQQVSVIRVIIRSFLWQLVYAAFLHVISEMFLFITPRLLSLLINFTTDESEPVWHGYFYSVLLLMVSLLTTVLRARFAYNAWIICIKIRSSLMSAVYCKALTLSTSARQESTIGEIVNLMAVDSQRIGDFILWFNLVFSAPLIIGVALFELWKLLGPSVLAGLVVLILLVPINSVIASKIKTLQSAQMKFKDRRIKLLNEIINGIKVLKLYAWEHSFNSQVEAIRKDEIKVMRKAAFLHSFVTFIWLTTPYLVSVASFASFLLVSEDNELDAETAFVSIALFNLMRFPITQLPQVIAAGIQAKVSLNRMDKFLVSSDINPHAVCTSGKESEAIVVREGQFSWVNNKGTVAWQLRDVNLEIHPRQLVAVVGSVGAGKSSLLSSLLGEINKDAGHVVVNGKLAYVSQEAWLQNATLKENITWGQPLDEQHYREVVEACALQQDLDMLPAGDSTEIGDKGINLSGGQKQRVALARAAYSDADILLLDDPLSAVDSHVGRHIFDNLIGPKGMMRKKTRVLVTHAVWLLPQVDIVVVVRDGQIVEKGTWTELLEGGGDFAQFLIQHITGEDNEKEDNSDIDQLCEQLENTPSGQVLMRHLSHHSDSTEPGRVGSLRKRNRNSSCGSDQQRREGSGDPMFESSEHCQQSVSSSRAESVHKRLKHESISMNDLKTGKLEEVGSRKAGEILIQEETVETGKVKWKVYYFYALAMGLLPALLPVLLYSVAQGFQAGSNVWLSYWSSRISDFSANTTAEEFNRVEFLVGYGLFGLGQSVLYYFGSIMLWIGCMRAGKDIHQRLLKSVLHLPMSFFDTNPSGRIMNRLSKDIDVLDSVLPILISSAMVLLTQVVATLIVIVVSTPLIAVVIVPIMVLYYMILLVYISTTRQLKRIESVTKSPVFSHFGESVQGVSTIRAFRRQNDFIRASHTKIDFSVQAFISNLACNRWLGLRLEIIGSIITFAAAVFAVASRGSISSGIVGLTVTYALNVTMILNFMVRMSSEIEANIVSVERIKEYTEKEHEAPWNVKENAPSKSWPENGRLTFSKYEARYRPGLELVLKGISCTINPGEKVGIVGRTGAGKSSLTLALFRIIEADGGTIDIDGIDISKLGLHELRSCLTIIPQEPVLFSGTLRTNLDPFGNYDDTAIWHALEMAHLSSYVHAQTLGLQSKVDEGGLNLSVGQRQLVSLARALLRKSQILVLDEATAAIDLETDELIQATIRAEFADCTVLTIAHRLNTIMDYDRVMVMDKGSIAEFNTPVTLLANQDSIFYSMAKDAGLI